MAKDPATVELHTDPRDFLAAAGSHLAGDPVTGTVIATVSQKMARARDEGSPQQSLPYDAWWAVARDDSGTRPRPHGRLPLATTREAVVALAWFHAFHAEADEQAGRTPDPAAGEHFTMENLLQRIDSETVWFWVDEDDCPVHLTAASQPAFGVVRIGPVFTLGEHRGYGYASAAVAEVSAEFAEAGLRVCLFTDQANPVSNAIYQRIGFRPVTDMVSIRIEP